MKRGWVFNLQRFSTQDGPGIRTTVFLKGCPLRCRWCHNPEGIAPHPELMLNAERCIRCGACRTACPNGGPYAAGDPRCRACGACAEACPSEARVLAGCSMSSEEVLAEVRRDVLLYDQSGGGATFSGGEPMLQPEFLRELLEGCRRSGIHAALDTCGYCGAEDLLRIAPLADLVLFDLKGMDETRHRANTGVPLAPILERLRALAAVHANLWLRVPVVPGCNDDPGETEAMARFAASLAKVHRVYLLPYHRLGAAKRGRLGREDEALDLSEPSRNDLETAAAAFRRQGLEVRIGGTP